jgi:hypothetical protein
LNTHGETRDRPLVAVVCSVPLLHEALSAALENIAEVHMFPADGGDTCGLLRSLQPDAVVVDTPEEAEAAADFAREAESPLVCVLLREQKLRVLQNGGWKEPDGDGASPEAIRNILVGGIFGKGRSS